MEVKLDADWILLTGNETLYKDGVCYLVHYYNYPDFHSNLMDLALEKLNIKFECAEFFNDNDPNFEKPINYYSFENIEELKFECPKLYEQFKQDIINHEKWLVDIRKKEEIISEYILNKESTLQDIRKHLSKKMNQDIYTEHVEFLMEGLKENEMYVITNPTKGKYKMTLKS
jgi:hypothetical protein